MVDYLFTFWLEKYKTAQQNNDQKNGEEAQKVIGLLQTVYKKPIMPGSAKLFWKNLFLQMKQ